MKHSNTRVLFLPALLTLAAAISAASIANAQQNTPTAARGAESLDDGQILQIVQVLNDGEIKQAELALEESDSQEVIDVAQMITADHTSVNDRIEMLEEDDLELKDSMMSESLETQAEETFEQLDDIEGSLFDCAYVDVQIAQHEQALTAVSDQLLPNARNAQVQELLTSITPGLEAHLEMAGAAKESLECN